MPGRSDTMPNIVVASVVTAGLLNEFLLMKYSFELFHGSQYIWHIRTDAMSHRVLNSHKNISCTDFIDEISTEHINMGSRHWTELVRQKMNALEDAWETPGADAAIYLDADLVFTGKRGSMAITTVASYSAVIGPFQTHGGSEFNPTIHLGQNKLP
jgi:hypothetical protein